MVRNTILVLGLTLFSANLFGEIIYNSVPFPLPANVPSLGYEANQTGEFGNAITFGGGYRALATITVVMSDWAKKSDWPTVGDAAGFYHPLTLTLYNNPGVGLLPGSVITSMTVNAFIPWRPEASAGCGTGWGTPGNCFNGIASTVLFDFTSGGVILPDSVIYGLSYNTSGYGANPIGVSGPYDSLNFGLGTTGPTVGSDTFPTTAYWNTSTAGNYTDGGAGGVGIFRQDTGWGYTADIEVDTVIPEPGTVSLVLGGAMVLLALARRKAKSTK